MITFPTYETYPMEEFDSYTDGYPCDELREMLDKNFDENAPYFYLLDDKFYSFDPEE